MGKIEAKVEKGYCNLTLTVVGEEWTKAQSKAEKKLLSEVEIKGFRKGKVPVETAKKHVKPQQILFEASNLIVDANYAEVIKKLQEHDVISKPRMDITKISDSELEVLFKSAIYPEISLAKISKFKAKLTTSDVVDKDAVEQEVSQLKTHLTKEHKVVDKEYKIKKDDLVNLDFVGKIDGKEFESGSAKGFDLKIGSNSFIDNFEDQLIGKSPLEKLVVKVNFPKEYPEESLAGKEATFDVTIHFVKQVLPLEGKELKTKLVTLGFKDEKEIETKVEAMVKERTAQQEKDKFFHEVVDEILKDEKTKIEIPSEMIEDGMGEEFKQFQNQLSQQGITLEQYLDMLKQTKEEYFESTLKPQVSRRIETGLIYTELLKQNKIEVSKDELTAEYEKLSKQEGITLEELKEYVPEENLEGALMFNKLIDKLVK